MRINIDDRFRLETVRHGWCVQQYRPATRGPNKGSLGWYEESTHPDLKGALLACYGRMLLSGYGEASLQELAHRVAQAEERIAQAVVRDYNGPRVVTKAPQVVGEGGAWGHLQRRNGTSG